MAFETVMSHPSKVEFIQKAKNAGYYVQLVFVGLSSSELSFERVSQRVQRGGHDVPQDKIIARYDRVMALLRLSRLFGDKCCLFE